LANARGDGCFTARRGNPATVLPSPNPERSATGGKHVVVVVGFRRENKPVSAAARRRNCL
jgi:hypothetical protein